MIGPDKEKQLYKVLSWVFGIAGIIWIVYGVFTPSYIFYPMIGLVNLGIAWFCKQSKK